VNLWDKLFSTSVKRINSVWRNDALLRQVVKNSSYLFSSSTLSIGFNVLASVFSTRTLDVFGFGVLGAVTAFAAVADKLLSFRIGELVIKYAGQAIINGDKLRAAAVFKTAALTEMGVSLLSYLLIVLAAPWAALYFAKDAGLAPYFIFYGLIVPAGFIYETSSALLQISGHFRSQAVLNLAQSVVTAAIVLYAFVTGAGLQMVLTAYLAGKIITGLGFAILALLRAGELFGPGWWRVSFRQLPPQREFWGFAFSSNFSGTVNLFVRDSDILWINYFLSPLQGGYYKLAMSIIGFMMMPIDPFIKTSFPEISKAVAEKAWGRLTNLLRRLTAISASVTLGFGLVLLVFGHWIIALVYGAKFLPALVPALILLIGYGAANIFFWNRPLILAMGKPTYPLMVMTLAGVGKIALSFWLVPRFGMYAQAALMSAYFVVTIGLIVWRGLTEVKLQSKSIHSGSQVL
jgi:O-antigen/teichoic acid export membrane protein